MSRDRQHRQRRWGGRQRASADRGRARGTIRYVLLGATAILATALTTGAVFETPSHAGGPSTQLRVVKRLLPVEDPGRFNLEIDGVTVAENVGDGGDAGPTEVEPDVVQVAERPADGTTLSDYAYRLAAPVVVVLAYGLLFVVAL